MHYICVVPSYEALDIEPQVAPFNMAIDSKKRHSFRQSTYVPTILSSVQGQSSRCVYTVQVKIKFPFRIRRTLVVLL